MRPWGPPTWLAPEAFRSLKKSVALSSGLRIGYLHRLLSAELKRVESAITVAELALGPLG